MLIVFNGLLRQYFPKETDLPKQPKEGSVRQHFKLESRWN